MRPKPNALMIFAAGFGTRMRPLTDTMPKPMVHVAGRPMIDFALDIARMVNAAPIVANLHYLPQLLEDHLAETDVTTVREPNEILDTGGGLRNALPLLGSDPVMTMNPDAIWQGPNPLALAMDNWNPEIMDALLICLSPKNAIGSDSTGDFYMDEQGRLTRGPGWLYGGVQIIKTDRLSEIQRTAFSLNLIWDLMISEQRCFGVEYPGKWCDIGHPEGIPLAESLLTGALQ